MENENKAVTGPGISAGRLELIIQAKMNRLENALQSIFLNSEFVAENANRKELKQFAEIILRTAKSALEFEPENNFQVDKA